MAKLAEIKSQQAAELKKPLPQRPEVMPATHTSSAQQNRTRYSDKELAEFKKIILEKLEQAKKDLQYLQEQIGQKGDGDSGISETTFASSDDGSTSMEREYLVQMASRLRKYIDHLDKALVRIENKTYGICRVTGKLIEKERLLAVPHATLSMEGKRLESHAAQHQEGG
ncbi:MAG: TraR/DksA family transcriptional regulator [Chitinophagales bacterium]|nr:TraR/DksA family transcriptional regulator [Chitinophagales bacterium]MDW8427196.1 TraR/DksA family transcriptional regulator [Chitinophagales bacterium]